MDSVWLFAHTGTYVGKDIRAGDAVQSQCVYTTTVYCTGTGRGLLFQTVIYHRFLTHDMGVGQSDKARGPWPPYVLAYCPHTNITPLDDCVQWLIMPTPFG